MAEGPNFPSAEVVAFSEELGGAAALGKCSLVRAATSAVAAPERECVCVCVFV